MRALDEPASVPLRGTDAAISLAFAPDGRSLVFLSRDRTLKRLSLRDGLVSDIATASGTNAPLWGVDGAIVFGRDGLWRVPAPGTSPTRLTSLDTSRGEMAHTTGDVLPSGVVLFTSWVTGDRSLGNNEGDTSRIEAVNPADGVRRIVVGRASAPMYAATGHLLFLRDDAIMAVPFDARTAEVTGDAVTVIPAGVVRLSGGLPLIGLSTNGTLVYAPSQTGLVNLVKVNSDGRTERLSATPRAYTQPRVAPDGTRVVLAQGADSLWLHDLSRDARTPLTPGRLPGVSFPIWSRDGRRVVYRRFDDLWWVDADGSGRSGRVPASAPGDIPATLALDGDTLAVLRTSQGTGGDIFVLSLSGAWPPRPLVQTPGSDGGADISPDGRWLLFASTDSGPSQVYLSPYPAMDRKWTVSTSGGTQPRWSPDGRQVFYREGNRMMAVGLEARTGAVRLTAPRMLFEREFASGGYITIANYDVLPDGSFVMTEAEPGSPRLTVVLNWFDVLKRKLASSAVR